MRLDQLLVQRGLAPSRTKAQELIKNGSVEYFENGDWVVARRASVEVTSQPVRLADTQLLRYVSRGGLKLEAAMDHVGFDPKDCTALDVGLSTGGFADCLLQHGAGQVIGIDAGTAQLAEKLRGDGRLLAFENTNIREAFGRKEIAAAASGVSFCVVDVSFISLELVLPILAAHLPPHRLLALIKPQFELSANALSKAGIVKNPEDLERAKGRVIAAAGASGYQVLEVFSSAIKGGDGNQEFFLWAQTTGCPPQKQVR